MLEGEGGGEGKSSDILFERKEDSKTVPALQSYNKQRFNFSVTTATFTVLAVLARGLTVLARGLTVLAGGLTVLAGGLTVLAVLTVFTGATSSRPSTNTRDTRIVRVKQARGRIYAARPCCVSTEAKRCRLRRRTNGLG